MARRALVEILGDASGFRHATKESIAAANQLGHGLKSLGVDANASARAQVQASERKTSRMRAEIVEYKKIASAAKHGSHEQVAAAQLAARAEGRLARSIGVTAREQRSLARSAGHAERSLGRATRGGLAGSGVFRGLGRSLAFASGGFLAGASVSAGLRAVINQASILQEETEKTTVLFGKSQTQVAAWSRTLASSFGISEEAALQSAGVFGNMFRSLHFGQAPAAKMSERLVELAADMASFNNASPEDTLKALQSGLAGQVRPLRAYGVFLSADRIKQEAVNSGLVRNASHLTAAQKVQAAYNIILRDTALQHGDVARNTESLSVSQSKLKANLQDSEAIIGRALLPELVKLANQLSRYLSTANRTGALQRNVTNAVRVTSQVVRGLARAFRIARAVVAPFVHVLGGAKNAAMVAGLAFLALKVRSLALASGFTRASARALLLNRRLNTLSKFGRITIAIAFATEAYGPMKKFFENYLGADFSGLSKKGDIVPGVKTDTQADRAKNVAREARAQGLSSPQIERVLLSRGYSRAAIAEALAQPSGEDVGLRGAGAREGSMSRPGRGDQRAGRLGLKAQYAKLEYQMSQAELTKTTSDDKKILQAEASNLRARIATGKGTRDERKTLNETLKGVNDQIASIDKDEADKQKAANDKKLALKKRQAEQEKAHMQKLRERLKTDTEAMNQAIDTARSQFGDLFQGPLLAPTDAQRKRALGVTGPTVQMLTADLRAQNLDFRERQRDLRRIGRRGGKKLRDELAALGPDAAAEIHTLAGASPRQLHAFLAQYKQREKEIRQAARDAAPKVFVNVTLDGKKIAEAVKVRLQKGARHTAAQRGGRHPGTVTGVH